MSARWLTGLRLIATRHVGGTCAVMFALSCGALPATASAQSLTVDGRWTVGIEAARPTSAVIFELRTDGDRVIGERTAAGEDTIPISGEIDQGRVLLRFTVIENDRELPVEINARLSPDRMDGEMVVLLPSGRRAVRRWGATRAARTDGDTAPSGAATAESVSAVLQRTLGSTGWPGITIAWHRTDGTSGTESAGLADTAKGAPMTTTSRMPAGSVGKTFVAAVALQLAFEGVLDLDAPISTAVGDRAWFATVPNAPDLTMRRLLQHSGGLPDHVDDPDFAAMSAQLLANPDRPATPEELIGTLANDQALFQAGQGYAYSDTGYLVAGLVLESLTGRTWWDLLRDQALRPAGLAYSHPQDRRGFPQLANGYPDDARLAGMPAAISVDGVLAFHPATEWTGGGVVSTSADLARWAVALYAGELLPDEALDEMLTSRAPGSDYGLGVRVGHSDWGPSWGHEGWFPGYRTKLAFFPRHGIAVAVQVNTDRDVDLSRVLFDALRVLQPLR